MSPISALLGRLRARWIPDEEVRAETWALGGRHLGEVVEGARRELRDPDLSLRRAILLRTIISQQAAS